MHLGDDTLRLGATLSMAKRAFPKAEAKVNHKIITQKLSMTRLKMTTPTYLTQVQAGLPFRHSARWSMSE